MTRRKKNKLDLPSEVKNHLESINPHDPETHKEGARKMVKSMEPHLEDYKKRQAETKRRKDKIVVY